MIRPGAAKLEVHASTRRNEEEFRYVLPRPSRPAGDPSPNVNNRKEEKSTP